MNAAQNREDSQFLVLGGWGQSLLVLQCQLFMLLREIQEKKKIK